MIKSIPFHSSYRYKPKSFFLIVDVIQLKEKNALSILDDTLQVHCIIRATFNPILIIWMTF